MKPDARETAAQLRKPHGARAASAAERMNEANRATNLRAIAMLGIESGDRVLEVGPGNGAFTGTILSSADGVMYDGLDWSKEMVAEARRKNRVFVTAGMARFSHGSSAALPFAHESFHRALAVHTIYFWDNAHAHLNELRRVLIPGGRLCLAFGDASFMRGLPFVEHGFDLYDVERATNALEAAGFAVLEVAEHLETGTSNSGDVVDKKINLVLAHA